MTIFCFVISASDLNLGLERMMMMMIWTWSCHKTIQSGIQATWHSMF